MMQLVKTDCRGRPRPPAPHAGCADPCTAKTCGNSRLVAAIILTVAAFASVQAKEPAKPADRLTAPFAAMEPTVPGSHTYQLAMSRDRQLCRHMMKIFNEDLMKYGYEQYDEHEEFRRIQWRQARFYSQVDARTEYRDVQGALFDINNDGVPDFVVRWAASLRGVLNDGLYVLASEAANRADKLENRELFGSKNKINISGWAYKLDSPAGQHAEAFEILEPFVFGKQVYIYMRPLFELAPRRRTFSVIARYGGGPIVANDRSGEMSDVCYFKRIRKGTQPANRFTDRRE